MPDAPRIDLSEEFISDLTIHKSVRQQIILTTADKLWRYLKENSDCLSEKQQWITPLFLLVSLVTTLIAAQFRDFGISKDVWRALYLFGAIASMIWLVKACIQTYRHRGTGSIDEIIDKLTSETCDRVDYRLTDPVLHQEDLQPPEAPPG